MNTTIKGRKAIRKVAVGYVVDVDYRDITSVENAETAKAELENAGYTLTHTIGRFDKFEMLYEYLNLETAGESMAYGKMFAMVHRV